MFRFLLVLVAFLGFCYYAFTKVEQSDGALHRAEIRQLQKQAATLTQERDSVTTDRDALKEKLDLLKARETIEATEQATNDEAAKAAPTSQPVEN